MNHKNIIFLVTIILIIGILTYHLTHKTTHSLYTIGILQTASHPALDDARKGFIDMVTQELGDNVSFIYRNAEGSTITAHTIAEYFHSHKSVNAIYTIATPALQAMMSIEKEKPIFIAAVSNPEQLNIAHNITNICGTTDMIDIPGEINAIRLLLPNVKTIALIYNPAETNSIAQINVMTQELLKYSIKPVHVGITTEAEISLAMTSAAQKVDAFLAPTDNLIASTMTIISHIAHQAHKPLIVSHNAAVKQGAFIARGVDYYISGQETGKIAISVLKDKIQPNTIPILPTTCNTLVINEQLLHEFNSTIPQTSDTVVLVHPKQ